MSQGDTDGENHGRIDFITFYQLEIRMTPIKLFLAASAAAFITSPVLAGDGEKAEIVSENSEKADYDSTVRCKRLAPPVGTRMPGKKVCKTNAAWRLEKEAARDAARESQDRSATGNTRSNG